MKNLLNDILPSLETEVAEISADGRKHIQFDVFESLFEMAKTVSWDEKGLQIRRQHLLQVWLHRLLELRCDVTYGEERC